MRTPCNPVNYRAGTGATCKQQEKNRLPVKGESYREPSSSIWTGGQKADPAAPEQAHNRRNNRRVQRLHERFWGARVRAMKNPARFPRPGFYTRISAYTFLHESRYKVKQNLSAKSLGSRTVCVLLVRAGGQ